MKQRIVIALGGNAVQKQNEGGTYEEQAKNIEEAMRNLLPLAQDDNCELIITHGNGPQVGNILLQNAAAAQIVPPVPMFVCGAMSQGQIGYLLQQSLTNLLKQSGIQREVVTVITQVAVDKNDVAFQSPSKPVGPFYNSEDAKKISGETGHTFKEDAGRGYRRVVPSPEPIAIEEIKAIEALIEKGAIVIAGGGGGIPVVCEKELLRGVDAVIDKDKASALLADKLGADLLIILTAIEKVCLFYGQPKEVKLDSLNIEEAQRYVNEDHFADGSMRPKIEAVINFIKRDPERKALIAQANSLKEALEQKNGTWIKY